METLAFSKMKLDVKARQHKLDIEKITGVELERLAMHAEFITRDLSPSDPAFLHFVKQKMDYTEIAKLLHVVRGDVLLSKIERLQTAIDHLHRRLNLDLSSMSIDLLLEEAIQAEEELQAIQTLSLRSNDDRLRLHLARQRQRDFEELAACMEQLTIEINHV